MSFRLKTILGVALIEALLLSVLLTSGFRFLARTAEDELVQRAQATARAFTVASKNALIASDLGALEALADDMLSYPGVIYARVRGPDGKELVSAGDKAALAQPSREDRDLDSAKDGLFMVAGQVREAGTDFGRVELAVRSSELQERNAAARRYGLALGGLEMALVALFSWVLGSYLTRQLVQLAQASRRLADGEFGTQLPVRGSDELADTARAFNRMSERVDAAYSALKAREADTRRLLENIQDGIIVLTPEGKIRSASQRAALIFGLGTEGLTGMVGRSLSQLLEPQCAERVHEALRQALDRPVGPIEMMARRGDGRSAWVEAQFSPIAPAEGAQAGDGTGAATHAGTDAATDSDTDASTGADFTVLMVVRDAQARVEARDALRLRSRIIDTSIQGIIIADAQRSGRPIIYVNPGFERITGYSAAEVMGGSCRVLQRDESRGPELERLRAALADKQEARVLLRNFTKDGKPFWNELQMMPIRDDEGTVTHFVGLQNDVTERVEAEAELRSAKDAAESAAHAKSEFLANMSHEIRTPLHGVLGSMEMLADTPLNGQQQRYIETARTSAQVLLGVIDEILDFSRLEAGKLRIESLDIDLHRTVEDVTAVLSARAHNKQVELACYIAPDVPRMITADPIRLRQVLINLVGNAIKFTERGEVVVSCTFRLERDGPGRLMFEVRDTGIGIAASKQAGLFEPFTQADSSTSRRYGGSGLGLSISRRLVDLMGGHIGFDSREGHGSRFWFELPHRPAKNRDRIGRAETLEGTRVLVVDDNATNRVILHRYLTSWNAQSSSASGGEEALAKLQDAASTARPYDLALLDLNMPTMDGYELLRAIQTDRSLAQMPIIMLSSSVQDPARMQDLRVDVWLEKPVRQSDLHDAIATVLGSRRRTSAPTAAPASRPHQFNGERVLLVEDNAITRELGMQMLRQQGFAVESVDNGASAVTAVQRRPFDVVLMDIQMPGIDGYEATGLLRRWETETGRARVPIVALTAHALPADRERCLAAGMDDYVVKPYTGATLAAAIGRWLMPPGQPQSAHPEHPTVLDAERLQEVRSVMNDDFALLVGKAGTSIQQLLDQIAAAALGPEASAALRDPVHRLKNTAGDVGARRLHEMAAEVERQLDNGQPAPADLSRLAAEGHAAALALAELSQDPDRLNAGGPSS